VDEEGKAVEKTVQDPGMNAEQIAQLVAAIVDQRLGSRLQNIEAKQATNDQVMEQLPGMVQQFQASLPAMIQQVVQQNLAAVMQQIAPAQTAEAVQPQQQQPPIQPEPGGAGKIPLGMVIPQETQAPPPQAPPQQTLPVTQQQLKASELVRQMGGGGMGGLGALLGGGGGGGVQDLLLQMLMKKLMGGEETQKDKQPSPVETVMGMTNMMSAFAESLAGLFQSLDMMRAGATMQRKEEAQIQKLEAESEAIVLRALKSLETKAKGKAGSK
jgi:hypothetical protein